MGRIVPLSQIMRVEAIGQEVKIGGEVIESNFLPKGQRYVIPIDGQALKFINPGDLVKIIVYSDEEDVIRDENQISFKTKMLRYEVWNEEKQGWDKVYENSDPQR